ncbi:hypothetical protein GOODEAATRI_021497 [Goodea atripinnis]|uniref:Uncharacterized protein n=1 Tax=Goodea atripinnis TaxID=208336 RepID=A0ABV0N391_9TELE
MGKVCLTQLDFATQTFPPSKCWRTFPSPSLSLLATGSPWGSGTPLGMRTTEGSSLGGSSGGHVRSLGVFLCECAPNLLRTLFSLLHRPELGFLMQHFPERTADNRRCQARQDMRGDLEESREEDRGSSAS